MNVLGDVVARDRRTDTTALRMERRVGSYSYDTFCTTSWKAGNLLRHYGVRGGVTVAVDTGDELAPSPLVAFFGSALLGAATTFDPDPTERVSARALLAPAARVDLYETEPGTTVLAYGDTHVAPDVQTFERAVWSENPSPPPESVTAGEEALVAGEDRFTHERLLAAARRVASDAPMAADDLVAPRGPLAHPGVVVAGILAPLSVGATVLLDSEPTGDLGVGEGVPEPREIDPDDVF